MAQKPDLKLIDAGTGELFTADTENQLIDCMVDCARQALADKTAEPECATHGKQRCPTCTCDQGGHCRVHGYSGACSCKQGAPPPNWINDKVLGPERIPDPNCPVRGDGICPENPTQSEKEKWTAEKLVHEPYDESAVTNPGASTYEIEHAGEVIRAYKAEIDDLREQLKWHQDFARRHTERLIKLGADNEKLRVVRQMGEEIVQRADTERCQDMPATERCPWTKEQCREAREALEQIASIGPQDEYENIAHGDGGFECAEVARETLDLLPPIE